MRTTHGAAALLAAGLMLFLGACSGLGSIGTFTTTGTVDAAGGLVESDDGRARVHVPPESTEDDLTVTMEPTSGDEWEDLGGLTKPSDSWKLDFDPEPLTGGLRLSIDLSDDTDDSDPPTMVGLTPDGEVVVPDEQSLDRTDDGVTLTATVTEPGSYAAFGGTVTTSLSPDQTVARVGERFTVYVTLAAHPDLGDERGVKLDYELSPSAGPVVAAVGLSRVGVGEGSEDSAEEDAVPTGLGVFQSFGFLVSGDEVAYEVEFECTRIGRGSYGVQANLTATLPSPELADDDLRLPPWFNLPPTAVAWRTGVVDCVAPEDHFSITDQIEFIGPGFGTGTDGATEAATEGEPSPEPADDATPTASETEEATSTTAVDAPIMAPGTEFAPGVAVTLSPPFAVLEVGETLRVGYTLDVTTDDLLTGGLGVTPTATGGSGAVLGHSSDAVDSWDILENPVRFEGAFDFRCDAPGVSWYGIDVDIRYYGTDEDVSRQYAPLARSPYIGGRALCHGDDGSGSVLARPGTALEPGDTVEEPLPGTLRGPCDGRAAIDGGPTIDPGVSGGVYQVPRSGSATYTGDVWLVLGFGEERVFNGRVQLLTPPGFPVVTLGEWAGRGIETYREGTTSWELDPTWTPAGVRLPVTGYHNDEGAFCSASVVVEFDGSFTDSPIGPASAALTLLGLGGLGFAGIPRKP